jgi:hypothetical protein
MTQSELSIGLAQQGEQSGIISAPPASAPAVVVGRITFGPDPDWKPEPPAVPVETSLAAADRISKLPKTKRDEAALLDWLEFRGPYGATDDEIKAHFGWDGDYERPRRWRLVKNGLVCATESRRATRDGNPAIVWRSL